jgi:hypothetical protein
MESAKAHSDGIVAFSQTDFTADLKKFTDLQRLSSRHAYHQAGHDQRGPIGIHQVLMRHAPCSLLEEVAAPLYNCVLANSFLNRGSALSSSKACHWTSPQSPPPESTIFDNDSSA